MMEEIRIGLSLKTEALAEWRGREREKETIPEGCQRWIRSNRNRGALHFLRPPLNNVRRPKLLTSLKSTEQRSTSLQSGLVAVRGDRWHR